MRRWIGQGILILLLACVPWTLLAASDSLKYDNPGGSCTVLDKGYYVTCHRADWKIPEWVGYHLTKGNLKGKAVRKDDFRPDPELPVGERAELSDYAGSDFDRGHMAPAADFKRSKKAMSTTFLLSNMAPQTKALNQRIWERLEREVRSLARRHGSIWIFTGNVFLDEQGDPVEPQENIGEGKVAVPTHCFKVVLCVHDGEPEEMFAFLLPNQKDKIPGKPEDYLVTVDEVEKDTDLDFFSELPDELEERLESEEAMEWPVH